MSAFDGPHWLEPDSCRPVPDAYDPISFDFTEYPPDEMREWARAFREQMSQRRWVRDFSDRPVPRELIEEAIRTADSAPSGANQQPWQFVAVDDPSLKREIREAAEEEEKEFYQNRATEEWKEALAPLGTDWRKPFLETAPWIVACFAEQHGVDEDGKTTKNITCRRASVSPVACSSQRSTTWDWRRSPTPLPP